MAMAKLGLVCAGLLAVTVADAQGLVAKAAAPAALHWAVAGKPLAEAVASLAKTTGVAVHYANLATTPVTQSCSGDTAKQLFECLLAAKADWVFRYQETAGKPWLAELWVWGSAVADGQSGSALPVPQPPAADGAENPLQQLLAGLDVGQLLQDAKSPDAANRSKAVSALALLAQNGNPAVRQALQAALADRVAAVRAQAVFGLGKYEDGQALRALETALQDDDVSVRLMAVEAAAVHPAVLQLALDDSDGTVRTYAANKLENLAQGQ